MKGLVTVMDGVKAPALDLRYLTASNKGKLLITLGLKCERERTCCQYALSAGALRELYSLNSMKGFPTGAICRNQAEKKG